MSGGWNTIESDAGVFTYLLEGLGAKGVQFEELFAIDADVIRQLGSAYGLIFLFKWVSPTEDATASRDSSKPADGTFDIQAGEDLFFAAQTIQNACGTQALLSVLLNQRDKVDVGDELKSFVEFAGPLPAELRGECLSNSELIRTTHNSFARSSPFVDETVREATGSEDLYHFIAYSSINGTLYELDGLNPHPISHGPCAFDDFPDKVVPVLQRRVARYSADEIRFNLLAMIRDPRIAAREVGDVETLELEAHKRQEWVWENSLRKHNFVGFVGELMKAVVREKTKGGDKQYDEWIEQAKAKTEKRMAEQRRRGVVGDDDEG